ncbi:MAG: hypothetical protein ABIP75_12530 [Pyrinomonadaceae bacterium]
MKGKSSIEILRNILILVGVCGSALIVSTCRSTPADSQTSSRDSVSVTVPSAGKVSRLLVSEGVRVNAGAPVLELISDSVGDSTPTPSNNPEPHAVVNVESADREVDAARGEVVRNEANVQRLTPLVAGGQASQAELDGARAQYDQSQQRLQRAQEAAQSARTSLNQARQPGSNTSMPAPTVGFNTISVRAPAAGTVSTIGARVGDRVVAGQTVATIRPD